MRDLIGWLLLIVGVVAFLASIPIFSIAVLLWGSPVIDMSRILACAIAASVTGVVLFLFGAVLALRD